MVAAGTLAPGFALFGRAYDGEGADDVDVRLAVRDVVL
jgi:hypothetical protein